MTSRTTNGPVKGEGEGSSASPFIDPILDDVIRRLEPRAFLFEDPDSYRAGIEEARRELRRAMSAVAPMVTGLGIPSGPGFPAGLYSVTEDRSLLPIVESF